MIGFRVRYFNWEGSNDKWDYFDDDYFESESRSPELKSFDLEVFDNFTLGSWTGEASLGLRWGEMGNSGKSEYEVDPGDDGGYYYYYEQDKLSSTFDGWGPTVAVDLVRPIGGPFSLYGGARASLLYGDTKYKWSEYYEDGDYLGYESYTESGSWKDKDQFMPIIELSLGLQWDFSLFGGCDSYLRVGIEAQQVGLGSSDRGFEDDDLDLINSDGLGLFGGAFKFGMNF